MLNGIIHLKTRNNLKNNFRLIISVKQSIKHEDGSIHCMPSAPCFLRGCFKNVICLGLILDGEGQKMSKSQGQCGDPWEVIDQNGADAMRWYLIHCQPSRTGTTIFNGPGVRSSAQFHPDTLEHLFFLCNLCQSGWMETES